MLDVEAAPVERARAEQAIIGVQQGPSIGAPSRGPRSSTGKDFTQISPRHGRQRETIVERRT